MFFDSTASDWEWSMKVLIIDDDVLVRRSLMRAFKAKGHEVITAEDGDVGIEEWKKYLPDIVFLDVLMPQKTGPQVLKEMGSDIQCYVFLMSAYSGEDHIETVENLGANQFLPKPFEDIFKVVELAEGVNLQG